MGRRSEANLRKYAKSYFCEILIFGGPALPDSASEISAEDCLDVLIGNSACSFPTMMLGRHGLRGGNFTEVFGRVFDMGCFIGVFHRGVWPCKARPGASADPRRAWSKAHTKLAHLQGGAAVDP